jgi:hypothetical protein
MELSEYREASASRQSAGGALQGGGTMTTTPKTTPVDPCRAERNIADRAEKAVELTESKLEGDPSSNEKRRLQALLEQQQLTLRAARKKLSVCEAAHPGANPSAKKAAPKKKKPY